MRKGTIPKEDLVYHVVACHQNTGNHSFKCVYARQEGDKIGITKEEFLKLPIICRILDESPPRFCIRYGRLIK